MAIIQVTVQTFPKLLKKIFLLEHESSSIHLLKKEEIDISLHDNYQEVHRVHLPFFTIKNMVYQAAFERSGTTLQNIQLFTLKNQSMTLVQELKDLNLTNHISYNFKMSALPFFSSAYTKRHFKAKKESLK